MDSACLLCTEMLGTRIRSWRFPHCCWSETQTIRDSVPFLASVLKSARKVLAVVKLLSFLWRNTKLTSGTEILKATFLSFAKLKVYLLVCLMENLPLISMRLWIKADLKLAKPFRMNRWLQRRILLLHMWNFGLSDNMWSIYFHISDAHNQLAFFIDDEQDHVYRNKIQIRIFVINQL